MCNDKWRKTGADEGPSEEVEQTREHILIPNILTDNLYHTFKLNSDRLKSSHTDQHPSTVSQDHKAGA